ncbi:Aldo/keto reductase [Sanghuangporus baumii]|uniref:Aldo/keto reductase n=1 Tax=Sanghuangporus baumii TaxID=108892 RepID=A0A9Q5I3D1_SANBA|nr:Aldo/keto reductase [Sanghuangporus baumii]
MPVKTLALSDGTRVPWVAFGSGTAFFHKSCKDACASALSLGFTHIDTAAIYENEEDVGNAVASLGVPRESLYVTTKLDSIPPDGTIEANLRDSLKKLQFDYVDLYLIHAPYLVRDRPGGVKQAWIEMIDAKKKGLTRSIGVSNFNVKDLEEITIEHYVLVAKRLEPLEHPTNLFQSRIVSNFNAKDLEENKELGLEMPIVNQIEYHVLVAKRLEPFEHPTARGGTVTSNQLLFKWIESKNIIAVTKSTKEWRLKEYLDVENIVDLTQDEINAIEQSTDGVHYRFSRSAAFTDEN